MTDQERNAIIVLADIIKGEINRMCITNKLSELDTMHEHAIINIDHLSKMIYDVKFKKEK